LLVIAYTGAITLVVAATIACYQTDIKRVLAYSTVSQLGYMMLALGVGGWTAGLFHLLTHAFFKALLFLGAGSVIFGLHHLQDLRQMGGLRRKMPVTAYTMLVGVLAISGVPLFSGWYSKDMILSTTLGFSLADQQHFLLFVLPLVTAGLTAFYMFRLWFLTFTGEPRDHHAHEEAHESPWVMTLPLIVLAVFSIGVGWGWPIWNAEASKLAHVLHEGELGSQANFAVVDQLAEANHLLAGGLALLAAVGGIGLAYRLFGSRSRTAADLDPPAVGVGRFLANKWYIDELYDRVFRRPTVELALATAATDKRPTGAGEPKPELDPGTLDGLLNAVAELTARSGAVLRTLQTGRIRGYVLVLALTVVLLLGMLTALAR
jgi:NADH-quinone oxidoreductase subunit L